jgi:tRNA(Leu) C34 or U34 (ribose-2'-O)-methylase TrmL
MRIALYQPDIAQSAGTILRLAACLSVEAHIIEPAGFPTSDRAFRRAGMDYLDHARLVIPMRPGLRSLNVAMACAMALGEALRQTGGVASSP